jgi:hypothetical protein
VVRQRHDVCGTRTGRRRDRRPAYGAPRRATERRFPRCPRRWHDRCRGLGLASRARRPASIDATFGWPLVALSGNQDLFTVPIGIVGTLQGQYTSDYGAIMAVNLLMILPIVALFLAFQRYFVEGLSRSGLR